MGGQAVIVIVSIIKGPVLRIKIDINDTVGSLKDKIFEKENIAADQQRLIFNKQQLDDFRTLSACGIQNESSIWMQRLAISLSVFVKTLTGTQMTIGLNPADTIATVK